MRKLREFLRLRFEPIDTNFVAIDSITGGCNETFTLTGLPPQVNAPVDLPAEGPSRSPSTCSAGQPARAGEFNGRRERPKTRSTPARLFRVLVPLDLARADYRHDGGVAGGLPAKRLEVRCHATSATAAPSFSPSRLSA